MKIKVERYHRGRARGGIYTTPSGGRCFLAHSKLAYIFCSGEKTISDAVRKNLACWSIDENTLLTMRAKGIKFVGVLCKDNGDIFLTHIAAFFSAELTVRHAKANPGRRYLPLGRFRRRAGRVRI
jgi:hypothetical protein